MDILILNWKDTKNPDVGGAEVILYELAKRLVSDGHTVTWFCRTFPNSPEKELIDGITVLRRGNRFSVYLEAFRYYRSLRRKPDRVLDCINTICWQTPWYVPEKNRTAYVNQLAKEVLFYELPWGISHIAYLLESLEYRGYRRTKFLCYSDSVKRDIVSFGIPAENVRLFPIGIDHARYAKGRKSPFPHFLFVARFAAMKRPDAVVTAMREIVSDYPDAKLSLVGYGPMDRPLRAMIARYGLSGHVEIVNKDTLFFTRHPKDAKVTLMQKAWALVLPSVKEGWGLVVTEAGLCGTPAIVTKVSGLVDSVRDGETGIVISGADVVGELVSAMRRMIRDTELRKRVSEGAYRYANGFSWEKSYTAFCKALTL